MGKKGFDPKSMDLMTGVYTKDYFFKRAAEIINCSPDTDFCIVELDVNRLTIINDMFGLSEGDRLLKCMGDTLNDVLDDDENTVIARIHADLFVFLCPYSKKSLDKYIYEIEKAVSGIEFNLNFELLISFGVYIVEDRTLTISNMCSRANLALKTVKGNYANHVAFFDQKMQEKMVLEVEICSKMNHAIKNKEFEVYFQPKHSLDDKCLIGAEALVRWNCRDGKSYSPSQFIPLFESNGFIMELDKYVWEETCIFISENQAQGKKVPPISVNISRVDLFNPELVNILVGLLKKYAIDPKMLKLEFTESSYSENEQLMLNVMEQFHAHGMEVEMDDFGSGYSSLNMLKDVPIDGLKIDLRFLSSTKYEMKSRRILTAVIHMSKWLGIPCIVEGVETEEQVQRLKSIGCTMVQGFYFSKPMTKSDFVCYMDEYAQLRGETVKTVSEYIVDPDKWWEKIGEESKPLIEMAGCYTLGDKVKGYMMESIMASDGYYEMIESNRSEVYTQLFNVFDYIHEEDKERFNNLFDSIKDYNTVGKCIYRRLVGEKYKWLSIKARLLERNDEHSVFFCIIDDVTEAVESIRSL